MRTILKCLTVTALSFGAVFQLHSQGYIVPNGVTQQGDGIYVLQNPTNSDYTGFHLQPQGKTPPTYPVINSFLFNPLLDDGVRTFLVSSNQPISLPAIQSGSYSELMFPNSYVFNHNAPFYLGFYTGYFPFDSSGNYTGIYRDPLFGWARMRNNQGVIELLEGALVYNAQGIYAGTQNLIPEPSGFALTVLGTFLLGYRRFQE